MPLVFYSRLYEIQLLPTNCLSEFDHFVKLALKGLNGKFLFGKTFIYHLDLAKSFLISFFIVNFEQISQSALVIPLLH